MTEAFAVQVVAAIGIGLLTLVNVSLAVWNRRARRLAEQQLAHLQALDILLQILCHKAFCRQHQPVWRAWTNAMGSFELRTTAIRRPWDAPIGDESGGISSSEIGDVG
jgi:hypothetical protein